MRIAFTFHITGMVQGVGLRWTSKRFAEDLDLAGCVQNNPDGSVTLAVEGEEKSVHLFKEKLAEEFGPYVDTVRQELADPGKYRDGFDVVR